MRRAFTITAPYLHGTLPDDVTGKYYMDYGPEMSRRFRALKVWMALKYYGTEGYERMLRNSVMCVEHLDLLVRQDPDFEALHEPNLLMYCFRYSPRKIKETWYSDEKALKGVIDTLNQQICNQIQNSGQAFIMSSKLRGDVVIRLSVCSHRTRVGDMEDVFGILKEIGEGLIPGLVK